MTLYEALWKLRGLDRFDVEPGPVRTARAYVFGFVNAEQLDREVERDSPMLAGALLMLLRHVKGDDGLHVARRPDGTWEVWSCEPWPDGRKIRREASQSELSAIIDALIGLAEAER